MTKRTLCSGGSVLFVTADRCAETTVRSVAVGMEDFLRFRLGRCGIRDFADLWGTMVAVTLQVGARNWKVVLEVVLGVFLRDVVLELAEDLAHAILSGCDRFQRLGTSGRASR